MRLELRRNLRNLAELTNTVSSVGFLKDCSKAKITNFDFSLVTINKNVVTLEIPVDYRGVMAVKIEKPLQYLPTPMLDCSNIYSPVF
jgi:hypothetical protein